MNNDKFLQGLFVRIMFNDFHFLFCALLKMQIFATTLWLWLHSTQLKCFHVHSILELIQLKKYFSKKNPFQYLLLSKSQLKDYINFKIYSLIFLTHILGRKLCASWKYKCCLVNWQHLFLHLYKFPFIANSRVGFAVNLPFILLITELQCFFLQCWTTSVVSKSKVQVL